MATINPVITPIGDSSGVTALVFLWETVTEADTAASLDLDGDILQKYFGKVPVELLIHGMGTFGSATALFQGALDAAFASAVTLRDRAGDDCSLAADGYFSVGDLPPWLRWSISGGTGQDIDLRAVLRVKRF